MTLTDIANYALRTIGLTDEDSREKALAYARANLKTVWDAARWKDAIGFWQGTPTVAEDGRAFLDVPLERVMAVRRANCNLAPMAPENVFQIDPRSFDSVGDVLAFTELGMVDGKRRLQLFYAPEDITTPCLVMGKQACPTLGDDDTVPLTGSDKCLQEFTLGDLYRFDGQINTANACFSNAMAFLDAMKKVETEQSGFSARIIPFVAPQVDLY